MYSTHAAKLHNGIQLALEYDAGSYTAIYNEHELALACRLVCDWHNKRFDDDGWIQETSKIWENAMFTIPCDEATGEWDNCLDHNKTHEEYI